MVRPHVHTVRTQDERRVDRLNYGDKLGVSETGRRVGPPEQAANRYPGAFSGGLRQRIRIARALSMHRKIPVADEAVSSR